MSSKIEPKFYAVDALNAYPEPVGTDDKLELNQEMGAVYVHLNYKRTKLVGLQSLDFLIRNLELIRVEALGPRPAPVVERQPYGWHVEWSDSGDHYLFTKAEKRIEVLRLDTDVRVIPLFIAPPELAELQATITRGTAENEQKEKEWTDRFHMVCECAIRPIVIERDEARAEIERLRSGQGEPVALLGKGFTTLESCEGKYRIITAYQNRDDAWSDYKALCKASQPAPVSVVLPERDAMRDLIAEVIGGDTYDCVRVWSAWGVGTMSEDDFVPFVEQEERLYELADACLDKVKELNQ